MAYSMFECPKLYNARSLKFYPDEYDHHIPFRHKNLPQDFELTTENRIKPMKHHDPGNFSIRVQNSTHKKCPIYVHNYNKIPYNEGDYIPRTNKIKTKQKSVIDKLEETYWANWKPDKKGSQKLSPLVPIVKNTKTPEIEVIKSAPCKKKKIKVIKVYPDSEDEIPKKETQIKRKDVMKTVSSKSQEIQTDYIPEKPLSEEIQNTIVEEKEEEIIENKEEKFEVVPVTPVEDVVISNRFLKHTDSFILNMKKQNEDKEHFDQPKCIRLYKKPSRNVTKNYVKGGSYPLKSCLKKDSNFTKPRNKFGRPGSPMIVSSSFSTKNKTGKSHRH